VTVIHCSSCGAPVDLKKDHACPHCRSALTLLDPKAVEKALQGYAHAVKSTTVSAHAPDVADALVMLERDRQRALREPGAQRNTLLTRDASADIDLWAIGIALVGAVLK
jgi:glutaredoxin